MEQVKRKPSTEIAEGLHWVKLRKSSDASYSVSIPKEIAADAGMLAAGCLMVVQRVGPCIVLSLARYAIADDAKREAEQKVDRAMAEWQARPRAERTQSNGNGHASEPQK